MPITATLTRAQMIDYLAEQYGTHHQLWRRMDIEILERAYRFAFHRWG